MRDIYRRNVNAAKASQDYLALFTQAAESQTAMGLLPDEGLRPLHHQTHGPGIR